MITHVAIKLGETIYSLPAPNRHHHVLSEMHYQGLTDTDRGAQGFLDDTGAFLTRKQALRAVFDTPQFNRKPGGYDGPELFSEDLW
jgi:hypothetical protein